LTISDLQIEWMNDMTFGSLLYKMVSLSSQQFSAIGSFCLIGIPLLFKTDNHIIYYIYITYVRSWYPTRYEGYIWRCI